MGVAEIARPKLAFGVEPSQRRYRLRLARYKSLAEAVAAEIATRAPNRKLDVLDVGCGTGRTLRFLEGEGVARALAFHGLDLKPRRLDSVYAADRWRLVQGNVERGIPFAAASFDVVICEQVLEHLRAPAGAVGEISRVLRPGGLAILGVPTFPWGVSHARGAAVRFAERRFGVTRAHVQSFDRGSIERLVSAGGKLRVERAYGVRLLSGGIVAPLEDLEGWYRLNRWLGRVAPALAVEIQILARRTPS